VSGTAGFGAVNGTNTDAVFYTTGSLTLSGTVNLTGTVVVPGDLYINSNAITITTKKTGQPALIVGGNLVFKGTGVLPSSRTLNVNGLCWIGGNMIGNSGLLSTCNFNVTGALMWGASTACIDTSSIGGSSAVHVNWPTSGTTLKDSPNWDVLYVPIICDDGQIPRNVKVLSSTFKQN